MINSEEITIKVSPEIGQAYRQALLKEKERMQAKIATLMLFYLNQKENLDKFRQTMDLASQVSILIVIS